MDADVWQEHSDHRRPESDNEEYLEEFDDGYRTTGTRQVRMVRVIWWDV